MTYQGVTVLYDMVRWEEKSLAEASKKNNIDDCRDAHFDLDGDAPNMTVLQRCVSYYRNVHSTLKVCTINPLTGMLETNSTCGTVLQSGMCQVITEMFILQPSTDMLDFSKWPLDAFQPCACKLMIQLWVLNHTA